MKATPPAGDSNRRLLVTRGRYEEPRDTPRRRMKGRARDLDFLFRYATAGARLLPDYIIIGPSKCGTTSLQDYLTGHPCVGKPFKKEINYFDNNYGKGERWYRSHFPTRLEKSLRRKADREFITGEATPYYLRHPHAASRIAARLPGVKIIAMVRNPVERTYSHYNHNVRKGREPLSFEEALDKEQERTAEESLRLLAEPDYYSEAHKQFAYVRESLYVEHLRRWFEAFSEDDLLVIKSEDLFDETAATYSLVLEFLKLPKWEPPDYRISLAGNYEQMQQSTRAQLAEFFEPYNRELYRLLGRDLAWEE